MSKKIKKKVVPMHVEACAYATCTCNTYAMHAPAWNVHMLQNAH